MGKLQVTKDFDTFVESVYIENYNEVYDLYQAACGNVESQSTFDVKPCNDNTGDTLIVHEPSNNALRLTTKAYEYFPDWIKEKLMKGDDPETYWGMEHAKEKDEIEEKRRNFSE